MMHGRRRVQSLFVLTAILLALCFAGSSAWAPRLLAQPATKSPAAGAAAEGARAVIPASLYVDDDNAGAQDGSALRPFRTVQQAINAANGNAVIAVAGGVYPENIRVQEKAVRLYGGYAGGTRADYAVGSGGNFKMRDPAVYSSHLKGNGKDSVVILYESGATIVDGFLITGGGPSSVAAPQRVGGGFYVYLGTPTISHNVIEKNQSCPANKPDEEARGGGIYANGDGASLTILNNIIRNNVSGRGAGVFSDGPKLVIRGNTIQNNIGVGDHGGGAFLNSTNAEISYNRVEGNEIARLLGYGWGGGMIVVNKGGHYKLSHNIFAGNYAPSLGAGFFADEGAEASMDHDLVYGNKTSPDGQGAAVYVDGNENGTGSTLSLNHVTIADNSSAPMVKGGAVQATWNSKLTVKNCIFWNNGGDDFAADNKSKATVTYTLSQQAIKGAGNLSQDPLFVNAAGHDYRLRQGSPALGAAEARANLGADIQAAPVSMASSVKPTTPAVRPMPPSQPMPAVRMIPPSQPEPTTTTSKSYLLRGTAGELPSQVGDDNTRLAEVESPELGGTAVQVDVIDSFGQKVAKVADWTPFDTLRLDIINKGIKELTVEFNLFHSETRAFATRVVEPFVLKPGKNEVRIAVKGLKNTNGSPAKLSEVQRWFIASETPVRLLVGDIFLESRGSQDDVGVKPSAPVARMSKTYLLRGSAGELPTEVGDDNTKLSKVLSAELGGPAVRIELLDTFGQKVAKVADWTHFNTLRMDIVNKSAQEQEVAFNVFHSGTKDFGTRVMAPFVLKPGKNQVRIAVSDLKNTNGTPANLSEVRRWYVSSESPVTLFVGDIFLEAPLLGGEPTAGSTEPTVPNTEATVRNTEQLRAALLRAAPGTTIALAPGRYSPDISVETLRGTKDKPIIIAAADERNPPNFDGGTLAFHFVGCSYVTLRGVKVSGCTGNGINADDAGNANEPSQGMVFENIVIQDIGPTGTQNGLKLSGLDKFAVRGCTFSGWGGSAIDMVGCHDGMVQSCQFLGKSGFSQDTGVQIKGGSERIIVKRNFFKRAGGRAVNLGGSTDLEFFRPKVRNYEAKDIEVAGNHIVGSRAPIAYASSIQCTVHHNTIVNPETWVLRILQEQPTDQFLPCQLGAFVGNLIVFDRRVQDFANVGEDTKPETFAFAGNAWFCTDGNRRPQLPSRENGGIYQVDPMLENAEGPGLKLGSRDPQLLKVGAHAFRE